MVIVKEVDEMEVFIPATLPAKIDWESANGKWKIVAKVDKEPNHDSLYSWMLIQKLDKCGKWINEYSRKKYPAYLKEKIKAFDEAIRKCKRDYNQVISAKVVKLHVE